MVNALLRRKVVNFTHTGTTSASDLPTRMLSITDEGGSGTNIDWFAGLIDEVVVYGSAFDEGDFAKLAQPLSVEPQGKFTTTWASLKAQRTQKVTSTSKLLFLTTIIYKGDMPKWQNIVLFFFSAF